MENSKPSGRLTPADRLAIYQKWTKRTRNRGAVSALADEFGVSHVTVSNIILVESGKRPNAHICPSKAGTR
ncbi:MAG: hypothetical protein AAGF25_00090 [Pseudomonadota bacterium]